MQQRQTTTKADIKEAFIQLLATKSIEDITISQLTKKSGYQPLDILSSLFR